MKFEYTQSKIKSAAAYKKSLDSKLGTFVRWAFYLLGLISVLIIFVISLGIVTDANFLLGLSYMVLSIVVLYMMIESFLHFRLTKVINKNRLAQAIIDNQTNIADYLDLESGSLFESIFSDATKNNITLIDGRMIILHLGKTETGVMILNRLQLFLDEQLKSDVIKKIQADQSKDSNQIQWPIELMAEAANIAIKGSKEKIGIFEIVMALAKKDPFFMTFMKNVNLNTDDIYEVIFWVYELNMITKKLPFWQKNYYSAGIGQDWASGYTPVLNMFSYDLSEILPEKEFGYQSPTHLKYIEEMEVILSKTGKNNLLLVGEPGVGKERIVYEFGQNIARGKTKEQLRYKHLINLDMERLLNGNASEIQMRLTRIFNEAVRAGNVILFIENFPLMLKTEAGQLESIDASEILLNYLQSERIQIIATSSLDDYQDKVVTNSAVKNLFTKIDIEELKGKELFRTVESAILFIEAENKVVFSYRAVKEIVEFCEKYIHDKPFPQKAIDIAEEAAAVSRGGKFGFVTAELVEKIVSQRTKIPVGKIGRSEKDKLLNLEKFLHKRVIGQDEAIRVISDSLRRARAGLKAKNKPIGSFLFIGPTGVGKTETAKALAEAYFGSEKNMLRFDMSEFQEARTIDLLIGSSQAKREAVSQGRLTKAVRENPYTLILFDELEKAHSIILNLFLQMLDEGKLSDSAGRTVDFSNSIIIATSNAGAEEIRSQLQAGIKSETLKTTILDYLQKQAVFRPEFLNRFDAIVYFKPLSIIEVSQIVSLMLEKLNIVLAEKNIKLKFSDMVINRIAKEGYDPIYGARPLQRMIQEKVENFLAKEMLKEDIKPGQTITIEEKDIFF